MRSNTVLYILAGHTVNALEWVKRELDAFAHLFKKYIVR